MGIRFINTYEPVTTFYRDLLPALAELGVQVEVYLSGAEYRSGRGSLKDYCRHPNVKIVFLPAFGLLPHGRWQKAVLMLAYGLSAAIKSIFSPNVEINFFLTQPPLFGLWGWVLKTLRGQRYFCMIMDLYPEVAVQDGLLSANSLLTRLLRTLARFTWKHADGIVVIGRCQRENLVALGISPEKIHFIPNWINQHQVHSIPHAQNCLRKSLGFDNDDFIVLYSGNMGISHEFETLFSAAQHLLSEPRIRFLLIGDGVRRAELERQKSSRKLENIIFLPFQPTERLSESLSMGDIHIVTLRTGFEGLVVPSKAYGALAVGRPLVYVGHPSGEIARMVDEAGVGVVISENDDQTLVNKILDYYHSPSQLKAHGEKAFDLFTNRYQQDSAITAYKNLLLENSYGKN
jgi:glycosyltransferase involved in cell wall biosynthesis